MNKDVLDFVTFCVGALSLSLDMPQNEVYARLKEGDLVGDYIVEGYEVLHTFGREYIVNDLIDIMKLRGVLA